jgi:hypothetical protein
MTPRTPIGRRHGTPPVFVASACRRSRARAMKRAANPLPTPPGGKGESSGRAGLGFFLALAAVALALALPALAAAQPFGIYVSFSGTGSATAGNGYLEVPDSPALNPAAALTLEGWVLLSTPFSSPAPAGCRSLIGKDYTSAYWLGVCGSTVRAGFQGSGSQHDAGTVPAGQWTHVAVTFDGVHQNHFINGELAASFPVSGPPAASTAPLRIGSDVSWAPSPNGSLTELRLWSVARSIDLIRATINVPLTTAQPGLVAVWSLGGTGSDALGGHDGTFSGTWGPLAPPAMASCGGSTAAALCLDASFAITVSWRTPAGAAGTGTVVPVANAGSGLFWFFSADNWELMVKVIDGCALNRAVWLFSAATTNVFYRMAVVDVRSGVTKIYFNYAGPPAPAVTDTAAFPGSCS